MAFMEPKLLCKEVCRCTCMLGGGLPIPVDCFSCKESWERRGDLDWFVFYPMPSTSRGGVHLCGDCILEYVTLWKLDH